VRRGELLAGLGAEIDPRWARAYSFHAQLDLGLEACERGLLARHGAEPLPAALQHLGDHALCAGVSAEDLAYLAQQLQRRQYEAGDTLVRRGDVGDALFLLMRGVVSVVVPLPTGGHKRLDTLTAGMSFGESGLLRGGQRTADVHADTAVECLSLDKATLARLEAERPLLMARLLHNLLARSAQTIARLTAEVAALEG
jgi:glutaminase